MFWQGVESLGGGESGAQSVGGNLGFPRHKRQGQGGEDLVQVPAALRSLGEASSRGFHNFWTGATLSGFRGRPALRSRLALSKPKLTVLQRLPALCSRHWLLWDRPSFLLFPRSLAPEAGAARLSRSGSGNH